MIKQLKCEHIFLDIDYNNITLKTIIEFKKSLLNVLSVLKEWETTNNSASEFDNFTTITAIAYGYINNPYENVVLNINKMKRRLEKISENIPEYWILDNISFLHKKQTFNKNLLINTSSYHSNNTYDEWIEIVKNFDKSIELYNKALKDKDEILKKSMRYENSDKIKNGFYYRFIDHGIEKIEYIGNGDLLVEFYHFGSDDWYIYHSIVSKIEFDENSKEYEFIWKQECPELYLI